MRPALTVIAALAAIGPATANALDGPGAAEPAIAVAYSDPPPELDLTPYATVNAPLEPVLESAGATPAAAVLPDGGVVLVENSTSTAYLVGSDASVSSVALDVELGWLAASPGPVVYGLATTSEASAPAVVAVALAGPNAGQVVAGNPIANPSMYLELPTDAFGNTPAGVIDRVREPGAVMIEHVDISGDPVDVAGLTELWSISDDDVVTTPALPDAAWQLDIERDPEWRIPYEGPSAPAPTTNGRGIYRTSIGPATDPEGFTPTMPVMALLNDDGTGEWYSIPEDWSLVASDTGGTIFARRTGDQVDLARLSDALGEAEPPTTTSASPTTSPPTTAAPATTAAATCPTYRDNDRYPLRLCDSSEVVAVVQMLLTDPVGSDLFFDGLFGPRTEAAVREFQRQHGLEDDGLIGPDTWAALWTYADEFIIASDDDGNGTIDPWEVARPASLPDSIWTCDGGSCSAWVVIIPVDGVEESPLYPQDPELVAAVSAVQSAGYTAIADGCMFGDAGIVLGTNVWTPAVVVPAWTDRGALNAQADLSGLGLDGIVTYFTHSCD